MTLDFLKHEINLPVEIVKLKIPVSILIMLVGKDLIGSNGLPYDVPDLCLICKPEITLCFLSSS